MVAQRLAGGSLVWQWAELPWENPAEVYRRLPLERQGTIVLHSGWNPLPNGRFPLARFCFVAIEPLAWLVYRVGEPFIWLRWSEGPGGIAHVSPWEAMRALWRTMRERLGRLPDLPTPLPCGLIGYLSYDLRVALEHLPFKAQRDLPLPDLWLGVYGAILTMDLHRQRLYAVATGLPEAGPTADRLAAQRLERLLAWLTGEPRHDAAAIAKPTPICAEMDADAYRRTIRRIRDYIAAGDVYQVNFSHRFCAPLPADAPSLFLRLCQVHPAPFSAFIHLGDFAVISASPERFLHFDPQTRLAHTRPIKGTRPRGATPSEDEAFARELLNSPKDRAEHVMIVDLERNDLGRVAETGSVQVAEMAVLEGHPTVWHLVSTIQARIPPDRDVVDLLMAMFPGGSVTGAPKLRAMEIIDELEPVARHLYTGCIGYWSFTGHCDFNIAIRTAILRNGFAYFHAGGGIVADSDPDAEYAETMAKAQSLMRMLGCKEVAVISGKEGVR